MEKEEITSPLTAASINHNALQPQKQCSSCLLSQENTDSLT